MQQEVLLNKNTTKMIERIIQSDSYTDTAANSETITNVWLLGDVYYIYYQYNGVEFVYPISIKRYDAALEKMKEAEALTQYSGIWIKTEDILSKSQKEGNKIEYKVAVTYNEKPMTIVINKQELQDRMEATQLVDRESIIKEMTEKIK